MAQRVQITLEDDLDGSEASETVTFGLDGTTYEIDLNDKNAATLRDALATYVTAGRKVTKNVSGAASPLPAEPPRLKSASGRRPRATTSRRGVASQLRCGRRTRRLTKPDHR